MEIERAVNLSIPQTPLAIMADWDRKELAESQSLVLDPPLAFDFWDFGSYWGKIKKTYRTVGNLYRALKEKIQALFDTRESSRPQIERNSALASLALEVRENGTYWIDSPNLIRIQKGISSSYFLKDDAGNNQFVVKPIDEDTGCLNNPKGYATPFDFSPIRAYMPLYLSAFRESAAWEIANEIGIGSIVPKTSLAILECDSFADFSDRVSQKEFNFYREQVGSSGREKLCSVQEFVPNSKSLLEALQELQQLGLSDEEIGQRFDQKDYEEINILLWITYDTDGHSGNFLCYPKGADSLGNEILGLKKIDNGLAFPDRNKQLRNHLKYLPNAHLPLSKEGKAKIAAIDVEEIVRTLKIYHLDSAIHAFRERIAYLKKLAKKPEITIKEINHKMGKIG